MISHDGPGRPAPDWLIGLAIAVVIVILGALVLSYLGAGDDPTFNPPESAPATAPR